MRRILAFITLAMTLCFASANAQLLRYKTHSADRLIDFSVEDADGKIHKISEFKGRIVVLNFWATWCPPCVREMPSLDNLARSFDQKDVVVVAVCKDPQQKETAKKLVSSFDKDRFHLFFETKADGGSASEKLQGLPTTYILDRNGFLIGSLTGGTEWDHHEVLDTIEAYAQGKTPQPVSLWTRIRRAIEGF